MSNSEAEQDFRRRVRQELGLQLTENELRLLFRKWCEQGAVDKTVAVDSMTSTMGPIDEVSMNRELREGMAKSRAARYELQTFDEGKPDLVFDEVVKRIAHAFAKRALRIAGDNLQYKAYLLLTEGRAASLSRVQLVAACQHRLNLTLAPGNVETIYSRLDPTNTGLLKTKHLIDLVLQYVHLSEASHYVFEIKDNHSRNLASSVRLKPSLAGRVMMENSDGRVSYDQKITGITAPPEELCPAGMTIHDLEVAISHKISDRTNKGSSIYQTIRTLFGDTRSSVENRTQITFEQLRFTVLKKFQLLVPDELLRTFFSKHQKHGYISINDFVDGVIRAHVVNEPLIDDHRTIASSPYRPDANSTSSRTTPLLDFLTFLRKQLRIVTNEEGRAPTYILSGCNRMSIDQAMIYLETKLRIKVGRDFMEKLQVIYNSNDLIDMRRLMKDAMSIQVGGVLGADQSLVKGGVVTVDTLPLSLQGNRRSPQVVVDMLLDKLNERMKNDHPLSNLHKVFLASGDTKTVDKNGMRHVLSKYDIILSEEDLENFMKTHERGDGVIDVRSFVTRIMSQETKHKNSLLPKDSKELEMQFHLAKAIARVTGQRRVVQGLNGPTGTIFEGKAVEKLFGESESLLHQVEIPSEPRQSSAASPLDRTIPYIPFGGSPNSSSPRTAARRVFEGTATERFNAIATQELDRDALSGGSITPAGSRRPSTAPAPRQSFHSSHSFSSTQTENKADSKSNVIQISSPTRPNTAAPSRSSPRAGGLSPRDMRSATPKYVYTGQPRTKGIGCFEVLLRKRMKNNGITRVAQEYGLFVKQLSRIVKSQKNMEKKYQEELKRGNLVPQVMTRR